MLKTKIRIIQTLTIPPSHIFLFFAVPHGPEPSNHKLLLHIPSKGFNLSFVIAINIPAIKRLF